VTISDRLREAAQSLAETSDTPRLDAELLMAHALGTSRSDLLLRHMDDAPPAAFAPLLGRRLAHEPVAYILGRQEFFGLEFAVNSAVLIPRADSEVLVERALAARPDAKNVLDCGTGSGALLLAVLHSLPKAHGTGIDRSSSILEVCRENAESLGLAGRVRFELADWEQPGWAEMLEPPYDLILANPPYVEENAELSPSVRDFEPASALFAGSEGLDAYRALIPQLPGLLGESGVALVEIGATQADAVAQIAKSAGFSAKMYRDLAGRPRTVEISAAH